MPKNSFDSKTKNSLASFFDFRPIQFDYFVSSLIPSCLSLSTREERGLSSLSWALFGNCIPHKSGLKDLTPIHHNAKKFYFSSSARFNEINNILGWFEEVLPGRKGYYAAGWRLTPHGQHTISDFFSETSRKLCENNFDYKNSLIQSSGSSLRITKSAIRSVRKTGSKSRFPKDLISPIVDVSTVGLMEISKAASAFLAGDNLSSYPAWIASHWDQYSLDHGHEKVKLRVRRAKNQAEALLSVSIPSGLGRRAIPTLYSESGSGRLYALGHVNLQRCASEVRKSALRGGYDIDVENCHWALLSRMAERVGVYTNYIDYYVNNKSVVRQQIAEGAGVSISDAKFVLIALVYGARLNSYQGDWHNSISARIGADAVKRLLNLELINGLMGDLKKLVDPIICCYKGATKKAGVIVNDAGRQISSSVDKKKILSHILQGAESEVLLAMIKNIEGSILLLQHDGITVEKEQSLPLIESSIRHETGYSLSLSGNPL